MIRSLTLFTLLLSMLTVGHDASAGPSEPQSAAEFLPANTTYNPDITTPEEFFGFEIGQWHLRPESLVAYLSLLASESDRVSIETIGRTHEMRPQVLVYFSTPDNIANLDQVRQSHIDYANGRSESPGPLVVWLGYSIHGNEASGSNASPIMAYYLAAAEGIDAWLKDTVVLIDPSLNPDGMGRFAQWSNGHRAKTPVADRNNREHQEAWPGGRFNHYWFDLNRDWLLLTHPESRNRVRIYQQWRPHVFADFHEMGSDSTYFFQPGVPERQNPLTPARNFELTSQIADYHARALDAIGQPYFSEESFDDYYLGKGSTYPDIQGTIGILFEQASARGVAMDTINGELTLGIGVRNHLATSFSTLEGARDLADELKSYQRAFITDAGTRAKRENGAGWVFGSQIDPYRANAMAERLHHHGIEVYALAESIEMDGTRYERDSAWFVPFDQSQYSLIEALFETRTEFLDSTFYDVSTWTFPLTFGVDADRVRKSGAIQGARFDPSDVTEGGVTGPQSPVYYLLSWGHYLAPKALNRLLAADVSVRVSTEPFTVSTADGRQEMPRGTLVIPTGYAEIRGELDQQIREIALESGVEFIGVNSGRTPVGVDLGSGSLAALDQPRIALMTGDGVSPTEAGEVWHLLDVRFDMAPTMVDTTRLNGFPLEQYSHLLMVNGDYSGISPEWIDRLRRWVNNGGVLITTKWASAWVKNVGLLDPPIAPGAEPTKTAIKKEDEPEPKDFAAYGDFADEFSQSIIGGAIARAQVDLTHPIGYGYASQTMPVFVNGSTFLTRSDNPYETPVRYGASPLISGFMGPERQDQLANSAAVVARKIGAGTIIRFAHNANFRGVWYGTNKLYMNAIFFGGVIEPTPVADFETKY